MASHSSVKHKCVGFCRKARVNAFFVDGQEALRTPLQGNLKTFDNKKIAAWIFPRKGAKIVNSLTLRLRAFA